mmetsp:Transcript_4817/g.7884  ORF Transcript_4817/g.7884 Transcript_4817/m.7884 type:complete len:317 (-) Transcript_4817:338-1288(-)
MTLLANSDSRILAMMEAGLAKVIVDDVIVCPSTNFDLIGIRVGCGESGCPHHMHDVLVQLLPHPFLPALLALVELLRNLCIPARTTSPQLLSAGAMSALVTAATSKCRDQNGAAAAAAGCRLLLERASPRTPAAVAFAECFNQVLAMDVAKAHPFVRVELARAAALATPSIVHLALCEAGVEASAGTSGNGVAAVTAADNGKAAEPISTDAAAAENGAGAAGEAAGREEEAGLALGQSLGSKAGVEFMGFLLASVRESGEVSFASIVPACARTPHPRRYLLTLTTRIPFAPKGPRLASHRGGACANCSSKSGWCHL